MNFKTGIANNNELRFYYCDSTNITKDILNHGEIMPNSLIPLINTIVITGIMSLMDKKNPKVITEIKTNGELGKIIAICENNTVKGLVENRYANVEINDKKFDVKKSINNGIMKIYKDYGLKQPYISEIELVNGDIINDFCYYFATSEQIKTAIISGVYFDDNLCVKKSATLLIQAMPQTKEETIIDLEEKIKKVKNISKTIDECGLEELLNKLFNDYKILEEKNLEYKCDCNEEKYITILKMLNEETKKELKEDEFLNINCDYCLKQYKIDTKKI